MTALVPDSPWAREVARLRCLRGIDTLSALGLCAEIGDFDRFRRPGAADELPRAGPVGELDRRQAPARLDHQVRQPARPPAAGRGGLALPHARPASGASSRAARTASPSSVTAISWQAQRRLHRTWQRLDAERGKRRTLVAVAVGPRAGRLLLGGQRPPTEPADSTTLVEEAAGTAHFAPAHPRFSYEQPPRGHARS